MPNTTPVTMRAKMQVQSVAQSGTPVNCESLSMTAVCGTSPYGAEGESEDNTFARYTPSASLSLTVNNPALLGQFKIGQRYYLDFTPAE